jgi:hypothetical protein
VLRSRVVVEDFSRTLQDASAGSSAVPASPGRLMYAVGGGPMG